METGLFGKRALITGGGTGIGRAIALALASEGADVAIASRNPSEKTLQEITALGRGAACIKADVSREANVVRMVEETIERLGGLDIYVNNAAAAWHEPVTKVTSEGWHNTINTNLSSCVWACREISKHMIAQGGGNILIVGSTASTCPQPTETSYRVSKSGLKAYMEVLAVELAPHGIRANMLMPGWYPTKLTKGLTPEFEKALRENIPLRRPGDPSELGPSAVLLLSDRLSGYTTGACLVVDGGLHLRPLPILSNETLHNLNAPE